MTDTEKLADIAREAERRSQLALWIAIAAAVVAVFTFGALLIMNI